MLRVTVTADIPVTRLADYGADTIEEAAANQLEWLNEGFAGIDDLLGLAEDVRFDIEGMTDVDSDE